MLEPSRKKIELGGPNRGGKRSEKKVRKNNQRPGIER
jgi:hypothetical protein